MGVILVRKKGVVLRRLGEPYHKKLLDRFLDQRRDFKRTSMKRRWRVFRDTQHTSVTEYIREFGERIAELERTIAGTKRLFEALESRLNDIETRLRRVETWYRTAAVNEDRRLSAEESAMLQELYAVCTRNEQLADADLTSPERLVLRRLEDKGLARCVVTDENGSRKAHWKITEEGSNVLLNI